MSDTLMDLGGFRFAVDNITYQSLKISQSFRWSTQARIQRRPAKQFVGVGEETLDFTGVMYPKNSGERSALTQLRDLAAEGEPLLLVDGLGLVWGLWVILSLEDNQSVFISNGLARKHSFSLQLQHYGTDQV